VAYSYYTTTITEGSWQHIATGYTSSDAGSQFIYVNGVEQSLTQAADPAGTSGGNFRIGARQ